MIRPVLLASALVALGLGGCAERLKAPTEPGVCYAIEMPEGKPVFNELARDQSQIEMCAARLEELRLRFRGLGAARSEITGAYQGQFIFIDRTGVSFGRSLEGARFFALARTGDGRLAVPGTIEREGVNELGVVVQEAPAPSFPAR